MAGQVASGGGNDAREGVLGASALDVPFLLLFLPRLWLRWWWWLYYGRGGGCYCRGCCHVCCIKFIIIIVVFYYDGPAYCVLTLM